jgi:hypothetical protein
VATRFHSLREFFVGFNFQKPLEVEKMTQIVEKLPIYFEKLSETEKRDLAIEVVRRTDIFGSPDLSDDELTLAAEDLFLALDCEEAEAELYQVA